MSTKLWDDHAALDIAAGVISYDFNAMEYVGEIPYDDYNAILNGEISFEEYLSTMENGM